MLLKVFRNEYKWAVSQHVECKISELTEDLRNLAEDIKNN